MSLATKTSLKGVKDAMNPGPTEIQNGWLSVLFTPPPPLSFSFRPCLLPSDSSDSNQSATWSLTGNEGCTWMSQPLRVQCVS